MLTMSYLLKPMAQYCRIVVSSSQALHHAVQGPSEGRGNTAVRCSSHQYSGDDDTASFTVIVSRAHGIISPLHSNEHCCHYARFASRTGLRRSLLLFRVGPMLLADISLKCVRVPGKCMVSTRSPLLCTKHMWAKISLGRGHY